MSFDLGDNPPVLPAPTSEEIAQLLLVLGLRAEDIAAALDTYLESSTWRGGDTAMTGEAIEDVLDAYYGGTNWRDATTGDSIVAALNSTLGNAWSMRAFERAPIFNIQYPPLNTTFTEVLDYNGTEVTIGGAEWASGFIPDGVSQIFLNDCTFIWSDDEYSWRFPSSTLNIVVDDFASVTPFSDLVRSVAQNPFWSTFPLSRTLDCSLLGSAGGGFYDSTTQTAIETLLDAGWAVITPDMNLPESPWVEVVSSGISGAVQIDGTGDLFVAQGDNGVTLDGTGLYFCETLSVDPLDWIPVNSTNGWPQRAVNYSTSVYEFYVTIASGAFFAYAPPP